MDIHWNTTIINPQELIHMSRGDKKIIHKYLLQFQELIPQRIESLEISLKTGDRKMVRQIIHKMSPQLQFFGIPDIIQPIRRLEHEYATMPIEDLNELAENVLIKLHLAVKDVHSILTENF
jgi:HPt (histidine-containing phosphotransfer) domain-containing protein